MVRACSRALRGIPALDPAIFDIGCGPPVRDAIGCGTSLLPARSPRNRIERFTRGEFVRAGVARQCLGRGFAGRRLSGLSCGRREPSRRLVSLGDAEPKIAVFALHIPGQWRVRVLAANWIKECADGRSALTKIPQADARGRFEDGRSNNLVGRRIGCRDKATIALMALLEGEPEALTGRVVERALVANCGPRWLRRAGRFNL